MSILCIVETKTGNTSTFLSFLSLHVNEDLIVYENDYEILTTIKEFDKIIIGTYTWAAGKIPKRLKDFIIKHHKDLKDKDIFVFGSGNSIYAKFCGAVDGLKIICEDSQCKSFNSYKFEQRFREEYLTEDELNSIKESIYYFINGQSQD